MYVCIEAATSRLNGFQKLSLLFVFRFDQSFLSLTILVPLWFTISFFKALFSGFPQFKGRFVHGQVTSQYRDRAPLSKLTYQL